MPSPAMREAGRLLIAPFVAWSANEAQPADAVRSAELYQREVEDDYREWARERADVSAADLDLEISTLRQVGTSALLSAGGMVALLRLTTGWHTDPMLVPRRTRDERVLHVAEQIISAADESLHFEAWHVMRAALRLAHVEAQSRAARQSEERA